MELPQQPDNPKLDNNTPIHDHVKNNDDHHLNNTTKVDHPLSRLSPPPSRPSKILKPMLLLLLGPIWAAYYLLSTLSPFLPGSDYSSSWFGRMGYSGLVLYIWCLSLCILVFVGVVWQVFGGGGGEGGGEWGKEEEGGEKGGYCDDDYHDDVEKTGQEGRGEDRVGLM